MIKKILSLIIIAIVFVLNVNVSLASFADFTDEQADKQSQEQIKEQEKEHNITQVKSSDNYLTSLQVEGYTLTPEFDKQTLEYTIKEDFNSKELKIKATSSNEKATINGIDTIKVEENKNEYRIDVTAENGAVRTYIIKINNNDSLNKTENNDEFIDNNVKEEINEIANEQTNDNAIEKQIENKQNPWIWCIVGILVIMFLYILKNNLGHKKKRKH